MTKFEFEQKISELIDQYRFDDIIDVLKQFKLKGGKQIEAYDFMLKLIQEKDMDKNEKSRDFILDVMDIISGYCRPDKKIWECDLNF